MIEWPDGSDHARRGASRSRPNRPMPRRPRCSTLPRSASGWRSGRMSRRRCVPSSSASCASLTVATGPVAEIQRRCFRALLEAPAEALPEIRRGRGRRSSASSTRSGGGRLGRCGVHRGASRACGDARRSWPRRARSTRPARRVPMLGDVPPGVDPRRRRADVDASGSASAPEPCASSTRTATSRPRPSPPTPTRSSPPPRWRAWSGSWRRAGTSPRARPRSALARRHRRHRCLGRRPSACRRRGRRRRLGRAGRRWPPDPAVVAIGETGLDYDRAFSPRTGAAGQPAAQPRASPSRPASRPSSTAARGPASATRRTS